MASPAPRHLSLSVRNTDRTIGTQLSGQRAAGGDRSPLHLELTGVAGQSVGAFAGPGLELRLVGQANDYLGKGLSGGRIVVVPPEGQVGLRSPEGASALRIGNVALYGATSGELFVRGRAGERFAVRNSGALAVVEGLGDHGCEYMTGGQVVVRGPIGRNFAAGMSGGVALLYDPSGQAPARINPGMVDFESLDEPARAELRALLLRYVELTASPAAWRILSGWEAQVAHFTQVMPREYRRALLQRAPGAAAPNQGQVPA